MNTLIKIIDKIKEFKSIKTDTAVADLLEMGQSAFAERKRKGSIPYEELVVFCNKEGISLDWLLTGRGPMKHDGNHADSADRKTEEREIPADGQILRIIELLAAGPEADKQLIMELLEARAKARDAWEKLKP